MPLPLGEVARRRRDGEGAGRRKIMSDPVKLWYCFLRKYPVKMDKQRIIDSFIADFYCTSAGEIDREFLNVCTEIDRNIWGGRMKA